MALHRIQTDPVIANHLREAVGSGRISHAYLFTGFKEARRNLAVAFAKAILCSESADDACGRCASCKKVDHENHEDLILVEKSGHSIRKDAVLALSDRLKMKPFGSRSIAIIDDACSMTVAAQNKLLKTLEEPPGDAVILLLAERKEALLPTVQSRCITYALQGEQAMLEGVEAAASEFIDCCLSGRPFYRRVEILEPHLNDRDFCLQMLDALQDDLRDRMLDAVGLSNPGYTERRQQSPTFKTICGDVQGIRHAALQIEAARRFLHAGHHIGYTMKHLSLCMDGEETMEDRSWRKS